MLVSILSFSLFITVNLVSVVAAGEAEAADSTEITEDAVVSERLYDSIGLNKVLDLAFSDGEVHASYKGSEVSVADLTEYEAAFDGTKLYLGKGIFRLTGELEGQIQIEAGKKAETALVLDNFHLTNTEDEAILCSKTKSLLLLLLLPDDTDNTIISGAEVPIDENCITLIAESSGGAVHTKADTFISGGGELSIYGYLNNGIHATKNLQMDSGIVNITAVNHGIRVKDTFYGDGGELLIRSGKDGIHAESSEEDTADTTQQDAETAVDGSIEINAGKITIESYDDGMQARKDLTVNGGSVEITATGTYVTKGSYTKTHDKTFSAKGLKSGGKLTINDGLVNISAYNDGLHSAELLSVNGGVLSLYCGDDGIHSDVEIVINDGIINISNSYEGVEANQITVNGGTISVFAWDDGFNANGGSGSFGGPGGPGGSGGGRSGQTSKKSTEMPNLTINGGDIYVNATGDGLDSNGNLTVHGGIVVVDGPTSNMNGPLDAGTENGGTIQITGGTVWAGGASGMAETFGNGSTQPSFRVILTGRYQEGSEIVIVREDGTELFRHTPATGGDSIVFSCPDLTADGSCRLLIDEEEYEITMNGISTRISLRRQSR